MAYRNGTYIAFAADGESDPTKSDLKYYFLLKARDELDRTDFTFIDSHDKVAAVRDTSKAETIKASLRLRLQNSRNMLLLVGKTTRYDNDFVPYEINYATNVCKLPIIVCYVQENQRLVNSIPSQLKMLWPKTLADYINQDKVKTIHIPFKEKIIKTAIDQFDVNNQPQYSVGLYTESVYLKHGV